jgi:5'-nucleotidase/UDP-sugar diphosphatase
MMSTKSPPSPTAPAAGLARVATLRQELLAENPNTFTVLAGDFLSPSALGTARVDGERLAGKQMVSVLNQMGLDYVTFGNHEFDISEAALRDRIAESTFQVVFGQRHPGQW